VPRVCASKSCADPDPGRAGSGGTATSWTLKVMVDIEAPTAADVGPNTTGHAYVELSDSTGRTYTYGFYPPPGITPDPVWRPLVGGCVVHPDTVHAPCVDYPETFTLTQAEFAAALAYVQRFCASPGPYHLKTWNCTTFVVEVARAAGKSLPPVRSEVGTKIQPVDPHHMDNPNKLYDELRRRDFGPTVGHTGDTGIRQAIDGASPAELRRIPIGERLRAIHRLLDGWVSDEDIDAVKKLYRAAPLEQRAGLREAIRPRITELASLGQRAQLRVLLAQ
jgi:hypothetical protein